MCKVQFGYQLYIYHRTEKRHLLASGKLASVQQTRIKQLDLTVGQFVLLSGRHLGPMTRFVHFL
jgi:hypothetical protein